MPTAEDVAKACSILQAEFDRNGNAVAEKMGVPTDYTDEDRVRLAEPSTKGRARMLGPIEAEACPDHPGEVERYRWVWDEGSSPEDGHAEIVSDCPECVDDFDDRCPDCGYIVPAGCFPCPECGGRETPDP